MKIYTSTLKYSGKDKLNITIKTGDSFYAPTWLMVNGYKSGQISEEKYTEQYFNLMNRRFNNPKNKWKIESLMKKERVVFVCYCGKGKFCHRLLLVDFLSNVINAEYCGEI